MAQSLNIEKEQILIWDKLTENFVLPDEPVEK